MFGSILGRLALVQGQPTLTWCSVNCALTCPNGEKTEQDLKEKCNKSVDKAVVDRGSVLIVARSICAITPLETLSLLLATGLAGSLTKEQRDSMSPSKVIDELKKGNERFRAGKMAPRD